MHRYMILKLQAKYIYNYNQIDENCIEHLVCRCLCEAYSTYKFEQSYLYQCEAHGEEHFQKEWKAVRQNQVANDILITLGSLVVVFVHLKISMFCESRGSTEQQESYIFFRYFQISNCI
ncbi:Hypothetical_protein [Hexamita inflata]|uniref:Hypothetical_protein n=1 Tax=Hexamita inflata TaxID=28002 RepID=A0ABP1HEB5_9EUKA